MPSEEYASVSSGALKLKGVDSSSKVHKNRKKKPKLASLEPTSTKAEEPETAHKKGQSQEKGVEELRQRELASNQNGEDPTSDMERKNAEKTEAELHYQDMRRRRLADRLKKEGTKTHKERVEDLNRYLNKLSEHHDM